jgi:glycosyltransferase involved in cell wall biosynthesis
MPTTCVVLPVYNEIRIIRRTVERVFEYVDRDPETSFYFVDDGSNDGTAEYLRSSLEPGNHPQVHLLHYEPNRGKGYAIQLGFQQSAADYLVFTDGDLAYSLDHLGLIREKLVDHEVVIGSRELKPYLPRNSSLRRQILGRAFNRLARILAGLPYRDTQAGLKGFQREAARRIFAQKRIMGFGFDVELLFLAHKYKYRVAEIYAQVDTEHSYKNSKLKLLRDSLNMFADLLRIRRHDWRGDYDAAT